MILDIEFLLNRSFILNLMANVCGNKRRDMRFVLVVLLIHMLIRNVSDC